jgi:hypothetical protein
MLVALAPTCLLLGLASGATLIARFWLRRDWMMWGFFGVALVVLGLNTRLPTFARDLVDTRWVDERIGQKQTVNVSRAVKLRYDGQPISARRAAYDYPAPACYGDGCFVTRGYSTPHAYWREAPEKSVLTAGLTLASASERAPTLAISLSKRDHLLIVSLALSDPDGRGISTARHVYRNGFPSEPPDLSEYVRLETDRAQTLRMAWHFMLHGNFINAALGPVVAPVTAFPVKHFLARNFVVQSDAAQVGGIRPVTLEVLAEKVYEPALEFKGERGENPAEPWPEKGWDAERSGYCDTLLRRQVHAEQLLAGEDWWLFARDPSGRRKIRRTLNELCEKDAIWSIDYGSRHPQVLIAKYNATGQLQYQAMFKPPAAIGLYQGGILEKTFHEQDGYVYFEWRNSERPAGRVIIKRNMALRFLIPDGGRAK